MIVRIVRMHFRPEAKDMIWQRLVAQAPKVRNFPGCLYLALHQDAENPTIFYSISHWDSPSMLEAYRQDALFQEFWAEIKAHFMQPAQTFTLQEPLLTL